MKIIMLHDCAYVAKELTTELVTHDIFVKSLKLSPGPFSTFRTAFNLRKFEGLIHAHFCRSPAYAAFLSGKPYLIHCHGTDVRNGIGYLKKKALTKAKLILYSTKDLMQPLMRARIDNEAYYLPTPVGPQFKPLKLDHEEFRKSYKLYVDKWYEPSRASKFRYNPYVHVHSKQIPYEQMPQFLNQFEFFIDQNTFPALSKMALEALACGLKVINWKGEIIKGLPEKHKVKNVVKQLIMFYEMALS